VTRPPQDVRTAASQPRRSFLTFLTIGGAVGAVTLFVREAIAQTLPADLPHWYGVSVVLAYAIGIVLSFFLQGRVTFGRGAAELSISQFWRFAAVAVSGALVALVVSLGARYLLGLDRLIGDIAASLAFAIGALAAALFNFQLSCHFVFRQAPKRIG
jgi:putative flippase GtrA